MSGGMLGQAASFGVTKARALPSSSEAMENTGKALLDVSEAIGAARDSGHPEVFAHRCRLIVEAAYNLASVASVLSDTAHEAARPKK